MELRAVLIYGTTHILMGVYDTGMTSSPFYGRMGTLYECGQQAAALIAATGGAGNSTITYNSTDHSLFEA